MFQPANYLPDYEAALKFTASYRLPDPCFLLISAPDRVDFLQR